MKFSNVPIVKKKKRKKEAYFHLSDIDIDSYKNELIHQFPNKQ